jgi:hypothetical protein
MPTEAPRNRGPNKIARTYDFNEGWVTIWYKQSTKPPENNFGKLVRSLRLARNYISVTVRELEKDPLSKLATDILGVHFGAYNLKGGKGLRKDRLEEVREDFKKIQEGLSTQIILCLQKDLGEDTRGETVSHGTKKNWKTVEHIHLNRDILFEDDSAIARTIIHEASHLFAEMPGTTYYKDGSSEKEIYENYTEYRKQTPKDALSCADSYAWAALSFAHGHVLCSKARWKDPSTGLSNDTFNNVFGSSNEKSRRTKLINSIRGPRHLPVRTSQPSNVGPG